MLIELENGSIIESIDGITENTRWNKSKEYMIGIDLSNNESDIRACPLEYGLKLEVRDTVLEQIKTNQHIIDNYRLRIRRINRWWYSVYFDKICNHENIIIEFNIKWCKDCGDRIND